MSNITSHNAGPQIPQVGQPITTNWARETADAARANRLFAAGGANIAAAGPEGTFVEAVPPEAPFVPQYTNDLGFATPVASASVLPDVEVPYYAFGEDQYANSALMPAQRERLPKMYAFYTTGEENPRACTVWGSRVLNIGPGGDGRRRVGAPVYGSINYCFWAFGCLFLTNTNVSELAIGDCTIDLRYFYNGYPTFRGGSGIIYRYDTNNNAVYRLATSGIPEQFPIYDISWTQPLDVFLATFYTQATFTPLRTDDPPVDPMYISGLGDKAYIYPNNRRSFKPAINANNQCEFYRLTFTPGEGYSYSETDKIMIGVMSGDLTYIDDRGNEKNLATDLVYNGNVFGKPGCAFNVYLKGGGSYIGWDGSGNPPHTTYWQGPAIDKANLWSNRGPFEFTPMGDNAENEKTLTLRMGFSKGDRYAQYYISRWYANPAVFL